VLAHYILRVLLETATLNADERQDLLFHLHFEERMMGLLGALIPDVSKVLLTYLLPCLAVATVSNRQADVFMILH